MLLVQLATYAQVRRSTVKQHNNQPHKHLRIAENLLTAAGGASNISCDVYSLLQNNPLAAIAADGTTIAQLVYGKGLPAGGLYCPGTAPAGACPVSAQHLA